MRGEAFEVRRTERSWTWESAAAAVGEALGRGRARVVTPRVGLRPGGQRAPVPCTQAPPAQTCTRGIGKAARSKASGPHQQRVKFPAKGVIIQSFILPM